MSLLLWGITLGMIGKVVLGIAVLRVHLYILQERHIDRVVLNAIKNEHWLTLVGLAFIVAGYLCELIFYTGIPVSECVGPECAALLIEAKQN
jgi:hypothetical protein